MPLLKTAANSYRHVRDTVCTDTNVHLLTHLNSLQLTQGSQTILFPFKPLTIAQTVIHHQLLVDNLSVEIQVNSLNQSDHSVSPSVNRLDSHSSLDSPDKSE